MFEGGKTYVFWIGLIILGATSVVLFGIIWFNLVRTYIFMPLEYQVPFIVGAIVFIVIGLYMMKSGVVKRRK